MCNTKQLLHNQLNKIKHLFIYLRWENIMAYMDIMQCTRTQTCGWSELSRHLTVVFKHSIELSGISDGFSIVY